LLAKTASELAASLALPASQIDAALVQLESEGSVMRGSFTMVFRSVLVMFRRFCMMF